MRILFISIIDKYFSNDLEAEKKALSLLNENSVFPDKTIFVDCRDKQAFLEALNTESFDALFVLGESNYFSVNEVLSVKNIVVDATGVFSGEKFVVLFSKDVSTGFDGYMQAMQRHFGVYHDKLVFKLYGLEKSRIEAVTNEISNKYPSVFFFTDSTNLDSKTVLLYDSRSAKVEVDKAIKEFILTFKSNIYAEDDVSLEVRLNELLRLRRLNIGCAESMTGGKIASKIISVPGASDIFYEGLVTYNVNAKERRLMVNHKTVQDYGVVSSQVAYEMAKGVLETGYVSTAISITGYAGATRDDSQKPEGLCYIGIGVEDSIEVYKYEFSGSRAEVIEMATNASLFLMIKTITNV